MEAHIHPDVEEVIADPTSGERMDLVLVVDESNISEILDCISEMSGVELSRSLNTGVLIMDILEEQVGEVITLPGIRSASPDGEAEILQ